MSEKIYIISPYYNTGGPKSLHQLANILVEQGKNVYIVYYKSGKHYSVREKLFDFCKAEIAEEVEDSSQNVVITSEYYSGIILQYKNIQKYIWWLSLDFYLQNKLYYRSKFALRNKGLPTFLTPIVMLYKLLIKKEQNFSMPYLKKKKDYESIFHLYNCEYVRNYLVRKGVKKEKMHYLCGPLEGSYLNPDKEKIINIKKRIVVYNPAKVNNAFLSKVKDCLEKMTNNIKLVPIKNMSRSEVYQVFCEAMVYVDFGYFPGPERMPREAVSLYCNIITSNIGSAENDSDVPIPNKFKFAINNKNVATITNLIYDMCWNFDIYTNEFEKYREKVREQILNFENDIKEIFV